MLPVLSGRKWTSEGRGDVPWSPAAVRLPEACVGLVTSAGVHLEDDRPFDMTNPEGNAGFRVIPGDTAPRDLTITHDYYDHRAANRDVK